MNLADMFLRELEKDSNVSASVRKIGQMLAEKHKEALETTAALAASQVEMHRKIERLEAVRLKPFEIRKRADGKFQVFDIDENRMTMGHYSSRDHAIYSITHAFDGVVVER